MSYDRERAVLTEFFKTSWANTGAGVLLPTYPRPEILTENDDRDQNYLRQQAVAFWMRIAFGTGPTRLVDLRQTAISRFGGTFITQVFTKMGSGSGLALQVADACVDIFWALQREFMDGTTSIKFRQPGQVQRIGESNGWYQVNVTAAFIRDTYYTQP